jgi:hypothetical protein
MPAALDGAAAHQRADFRKVEQFKKLKCEAISIDLLYQSG